MRALTGWMHGPWKTVNGDMSARPGITISGALAGATALFGGVVASDECR